MKVASMWSGGKDSCFSCYLAAKSGHDVRYLVNFISPETGGSVSHGLSASLIKKQAGLTGIPLLQPEVYDSTPPGYKNIYQSTLSKLVGEGIEAVVFGDIFLEAHKVWLDEVCAGAGVKPLYPLWGKDTGEIITQFIAEGFKCKVVAANPGFMGEEWLGREIDKIFIEDLKKQPGVKIDPCGEFGEFHTLVVDGPIFRKPLRIIEARKVNRDGKWFLEIVRYE